MGLPFIPGLQLHWRLGYIRRADFIWGLCRSKKVLRQRLGALLNHPSSQLMTHLFISEYGPAWARNMAPVIQALRKLGPRAALKYLKIGTFDLSDVAGAEPLISLYPNLVLPKRETEYVVANADLITVS